MKLHYSQTVLVSVSASPAFQYLMKLHYSQTLGVSKNEIIRFQYLMKLHYSQTYLCRLVFSFAVSVPYEITLLSNIYNYESIRKVVSVPYEITLLSNRWANQVARVVVSVPYEITLLSNELCHFDMYRVVSVPYEITLLSNRVKLSKNRRKFQYLMKLHYSQTSNKLRHYNAQGNNIRYIYYTI